jgi:archaellum biogenesis protein FlaJ (TadC family)
MLQYKLERQRYTESISTFSDIYTGIMVASPLFFVAVLSLVSILGGTVGNMDINTLMVLGTYVAIPAMNLLFMGFMELTQPNL